MGHCQPLDRGGKVSRFALFLDQAGREILGFAVQLLVDIWEQRSWAQQGFPACLIQLHIRQIVIIKTRQDFSCVIKIIAIDISLNSFRHAANKKITVYLLHGQFVCCRWERLSFFVSLYNRIVQDSIAVHQELIEGHRIDRDLVDLSHREQKLLFFSPSSFIRLALNFNPHHGACRNHRDLTIVLAKILERRNDIGAFLNLIKDQQGILRDFLALQQRNVFDDLFRVCCLSAECTDFIFNLAVNIDIAVFVVGLSEDILNQIGFSYLSCAPYNQRLPAAAAIPINQLLHSITIHKQTSSRHSWKHYTNYLHL